MNRKSEKVNSNLISTLIQNPKDVELAVFLLSHGYSIRDFYLFKQMSEFIRLEWDSIEIEE